MDGIPLEDDVCVCEYCRNNHVEEEKHAKSVGDILEEVAVSLVFLSPCIVSYNNTQ